MMARWFGGAAVASAALLALVGLSQVPWTVTPDDRALLRASWRVLGEHIEACRPATEAELAKMAAHMRQTVICEEPRVAPYTLRIAVDGEARVAGLAAGSGVTGDRPIYVLHESSLSPGTHHLTVEFRREHAESSGQRGSVAGDSSRRAVPPLLQLDTTVRVVPHEVLLVTYSAELRELHLVRRAQVDPR